MMRLMQSHSAGLEVVPRWVLLEAWLKACWAERVVMPKGEGPRWSAMWCGREAGGRK